MNVLEVTYVTPTTAVALVDDPKDGSTKLVVVHLTGEDAVVLDFDSLITTEALTAAGPREAMRVTRELRSQLWDSESGHAVS